MCLGVVFFWFINGVEIIFVATRSNRENWTKYHSLDPQKLFSYQSLANDWTRQLQVYTPKFDIPLTMKFSRYHNCKFQIYFNHRHCQVSPKFYIILQNFRIVGVRQDRKSRVHLIIYETFFLLSLSLGWSLFIAVCLLLSVMYCVLLIRVTVTVTASQCANQVIDVTYVHCLLNSWLMLQYTTQLHEYMCRWRNCRIFGWRSSLDVCRRCARARLNGSLASYIIHRSLMET